MYISINSDLAFIHTNTNTNSTAMTSSTMNKLKCALSLLLITALISTQGFTVDLIHRDSPKSPLYNPSLSQFDRLRDAVTRSMSRVIHFSPSSLPLVTVPMPAPAPFLPVISAPTPEPIPFPFISVPAQSPSGGAETIVKSGQGEYIMNISLGTPPFQIQAIADTGSDLIWTQCEPCINCYKQNDPVYDPAKSSTYRQLSCQSAPCIALGIDGTCDSQRHCAYHYAYGDSSYTNGGLSAETVTLSSSGGRPVQVASASFGCGHDNQGTFQDTASGIIGLGGGPLSLVSQLGPTAAGRFSYCLVPWDDTESTSKIKFGPDAVVSGSGAVSTPLVSKYPVTFYYLTLEAVSVGDKKLLAPSGTASEGNIIIDSGTTLTYLPDDMFNGLVDALVGSIAGGNRTDDPSGTFSLCYTGDAEYPDITAHFSGGADVVLPPTNTFVEIEEGLMCLVMVSGGDFAIFGNLSQMNFLIGYDLQAKTVSFKPTDCTAVSQ